MKTVNAIHAGAKNAVRRALKFIFPALAFAVLPVMAGQSVALEWSASMVPVAGYNIYYGIQSGNYPNKISVGNATSTTISNLMQGVTYYFTATDYDELGDESPFSEEIAYTVPEGAFLSLTTVPGPIPSLSLTAKGNVPAQWALECSSNLSEWTQLFSGTDPAINIFLSINHAVPAQFFRLVSQ